MEGETKEKNGREILMGEEKGEGKGNGKGK